MGRARRARKIAATAAYGGGGLAAVGAALGAAGWGVIKAEAALARRVIGTPFDDSPDDGGIYGSGRGEPYDVVVLGDSSAAGMGADAAARDGGRHRLQRRRGADRPPGAPDEPGRRGRGVQRPRAAARQRPRGRAAARRRHHHGGRQRRDAPHRAVGVGAAARADGAAHPRPRGRGRRGHLPRPRDDPADPAAVAPAHEAVVARPRGRPDRRRRRGRRPHRVAGRPARAGVRGVAARDVQPGPLPPLGRGLRAGRRGTAAERVRRPRGLGRRHVRPGAGAPAWGGRRAGRRGRRPGRQGAGHRGRAHPDRRPVTGAARPLGRGAAPPPRRRAPCRGPGRRPGRPGDRSQETAPPD